jgi:hypothetical protein
MEMASEQRAGDEVRDVLKTWDTPTDMDVLTLARLRVLRIAELEAALQSEKEFAADLLADMELMREAIEYAHAHGFEWPSDPMPKRANPLTVSGPSA